MLLTSMRLLSDFAVIAGSSYSAARHGLLLEHLKKSRNRQDAALMLRPGLDTNRQMLEVTTGPAYMRFVSALPGVDPDVIAGNKPRRDFPPPRSR